MKNKLTISFVFIIFITLFLTNGAFAASGKIIVGVSPEYAPFAFKNASGDIDGIDIALLKEVGERIGVAVEFYFLPFDVIFDSLKAGTIDVAAGGISVNEAEAADISYTIAFYKAGAVAVSLNTAAFSPSTDLNDFKGKKVGVQKKSDMAAFAENNLVASGISGPNEIKTYEKISDMTDALYKGDTDIVLMDRDVYESMYKNSGKYQVFMKDVETIKYVFGTSKDSGLATELSKTLKAIAADGTAQQIADRYFGVNYLASGTSAAGNAAVNTENKEVVRPETAAPAILPTIPAPLTGPAQQIQHTGQNASAINPSAAAPTTSASGCINSMNFVADVSIPDGTKLRPGEKFTKKWNVVNNGTCTWNSSYKLVSVSGGMEGTAAAITENVEPGKTVEVSVNFTAPEEKGQYRSSWQMNDSEGRNFGAVLYASIVTDGEAMDYSKDKPLAINYFYADPNEGSTAICPTIYWDFSNADYFEISIDGKIYYRGSEGRASLQPCTELSKAGEHTISLWIKNEFHEKSTSFKYKSTELYTSSEDDYYTYFPEELPKNNIIMINGEEVYVAP